MKKKILIPTIAIGIIVFIFFITPSRRQNLSPEQVFKSTLQIPIPASVTNIQVHSLFLPTMGDGGALYQFEISSSDFDDLIKQTNFEKKEITKWRKNNRLFANPEFNLENPEYYTSESENEINRLQLKVNQSHTKVFVDFNGFFKSN
ncbi:hypothetical protein P4C99_20865 [Pontiellaceae bacterium B1224]|nr:hypothetical protein [Pontiellaceae bacterium B1224]